MATNPKVVSKLETLIAKVQLGKVVDDAIPSEVEKLCKSFSKADLVTACETFELQATEDDVEDVLQNYLKEVSEEQKRLKAEGKPEEAPAPEGTGTSIPKDELLDAVKGAEGDAKKLNEKTDDKMAKARAAKKNRGSAKGEPDYTEDDKAYIAEHGTLYKCTGPLIQQYLDEGGEMKASEIREWLDKNNPHPRWMKYEKESERTFMTRYLAEQLVNKKTLGTKKAEDGKSVLYFSTKS